MLWICIISLTLSYGLCLKSYTAWRLGSNRSSHSTNPSLILRALCVERLFGDEENLHYFTIVTSR
jgi:hypothetical protein